MVEIDLAMIRDNIIVEQHDSTIDYLSNGDVRVQQSEWI